MKGTYSTKDHLGTWRWFKDGVLHRENGPAIEWDDGDKYWYKNNVLHREAGPAIECVNPNDNQYYLDGAFKTKAQFDSIINKKKNLKYSKDNPPTAPGTYDLGDGISIYIAAYGKDTFTLWQRDYKNHRDDGPAIIDQWGNKEYWVDGKRHREDGPAVEHANGDKEYHVNGEPHRLDGPALDYINGAYHWYKDGLRHCETGPASWIPGGRKEYYLNDKKVSKKVIDALIASKNSEEVYDLSEEKIKEIDERAIKVIEAHMKPIPYSETNLPTEIGIYDFGNGKSYIVTENFVMWKNNGLYHKLDGPAMIFKDGTKKWFVDDKLHRSDGPAIEWGITHRKDWYQEGFLHRLDGPAIEYVNGDKCWYVNGNVISEEKFNMLTKLSDSDDKKQYSNTEVVLKKKETTMSNKSFGEKFKEAQLEGAKRNVVRTGTNATMNGMRLALLSTGLAGPTNAVNAFMSTPLAAGLTKTAVGLGLDHIPQLKGKPLTKTFSREFRVQGMEDLQEIFLDEFMKNLMPAIIAEFKNMEKNSNIRVKTDQEETKEEGELLEDEDFVSQEATKSI